MKENGLYLARFAFFVFCPIFGKLIRKPHTGMLLKLVTENGKRRTGSGNAVKSGTGNQEPESGNESTAVTRLIIQKGGQRKRKGNNYYLGKYEEVLRL